MTPDRLGPYRIEKLLGTGGMGAVYGGVDDTTGQRAALKVLAPQIAADEVFRARFESEIKTLKKLRHPHIVQLYGFGEHEGQLFYSMEWVKGSSLQEKLKEDGPLPWREAVAIAIDISLALKHAHDRGIIHRDLKPANLLIDEQGQVKLTDFGIAKLFGGSALTGAGGVVGTADYMAPEQAAGKVLSHRVDLYSLGGVLYAMITGRPPFLGNSLVEVLDMLQHDQPTPVSRLMPKIPRAIDAIVLQLLEKDPQKRIPTALAAANQLRSLSHALSPERTAADRPEEEFTLSESATEVTPPSEDSAKIASRETAAISDDSLKSRGGTEVGPAEDSSANEASVGGEPPLGHFRAGFYHDDTAGELPASRQESDDAPSRFTAVTAEELGTTDSSQFTFDDDTVSWSRLAALAAAMIVLAALGWYSLKPPTAAQLWQRIEAHAAADDPAQLLAAEEQIAQFLQRFPTHPRTPEVQAFAEEIELMRLQRRMQQRLRRNSNSQPLGAAEQLYLEAMALAPAQPQQAAVQLRSLIALYTANAKADSETQQLMDLARRQLAVLEEEAAASQREHLALLEERWKFAASLQESDPAAAEEIYRAIVTLYDDEAWAETYVARARQALQR